MNNKAIVFFVMPFEEDFLSLYDHLKERFKDKFAFTNAGDLDNQQNILKDIVEGIGNADVVIADLTGLNSNVSYELGLAHAMNKKTIIITQSISELPFDLKSYRAVEYSLQFNKLPPFLEELHKLLQGAIDGSVKYGNPVSDYYPEFVSQIDNTSVVTFNGFEEDNQKKEDKDSGERGFIDFIADIEENTNQMTDELNAITSDLEEMTESLNNASSEIDRVNNQSGNGNNTASFIRSVCRKLSVHINTFSDKFSNRILSIDNYWSNIENSYLSLLEDNHIVKNTNIDAIITNVKSLEELLYVICNSDTEIENFKTSMEGCLGLERRLTQAITGLISKTENYLSFTEKMSSSIERICARSERVINEFQNEKDKKAITEQ